LLHLADRRDLGEGAGMRLGRSGPIPAIERSAFVGFRFPPEIIVLAVWGTVALSAVVTRATGPPPLFAVRLSARVR